MLSAMTTSENFPLINQSRCSPSPQYNPVIQPGYVATILRQNLQVMSNDGNILKYQLIQEPEINKAGEMKFGKIYSATDMEKIKSITSFVGWKTCRKNSCKLSGGGLMERDDGFLIDDSHCHVLANQISPSTPLTFDLTSPQNVINCCVSERRRRRGMSDIVVGNTKSSEIESTNPFKNFIVNNNNNNNDFVENEKPFSPTNPFSDLCASSSPNRFSQIEYNPPIRYENIIIPHKSFSQCSTRPASPVLRNVNNNNNNKEESTISNPFLINDTSQDSILFDTRTSKLFIKDSLQSDQSGSSLKNHSSFIFAVPVLSLISPQSSITNSTSTQTTGDIEEMEKIPKRSKESPPPVYQNLTNQLEKFIKMNDHSDYDLMCLKTTVKDLRTSGWYYENVSWQESVILLKDTDPGTFLIRDSSDPNFLFSLSVQTSRGPTSVRLHYVNGHFRLDAEEKLIPHMPSFGSVIELIDYYVENTVKNKTTSKKNGQKTKQQQQQQQQQWMQKSKDQVWIDSQGNVYSNILLVKPLYKKDHFSSLQHLARLTINFRLKKRLNVKIKNNNNFKVTPVYESSPFQDSTSFFQYQNNFESFCPILSANALPIPPKLIEYLQDYPYCH
ncbi:suppressor of cytokine signaling-2, putative [Pediculus humanus corporis]|uniref:Suppressor of cytokine signaling-2, putative n=1 Tax=Pediculus humanus subsp. corporis TaxID=121224 RepID=E0VHG6_PEDHC|nr:suppressor of cytokine signaling-2, putative [Pediculus humanus corporis]EEB12822.1 suppressor of cytokine signaling-2, putative [Pediculus humanus corporis]